MVTRPRTAHGAPNSSNVVLPSAIHEDSGRSADPAASGHGAAPEKGGVATAHGTHHYTASGSPQSNHPDTARIVSRPTTAPTRRTERRQAIVPIENTLFADPETGRVESLHASPRPSDTPVTRVEVTFAEDSLMHPQRESYQPGVNETNNHRKSSALSSPGARRTASQEEFRITTSQTSGAASSSEGEHCSMVPSSVMLATESPYGCSPHPGATTTSEDDCPGSLIFATKSSSISANGSSTPRRNSLGRLLNASPTISSRIHPVVTYAPTATGDDDSDEEDRQEHAKPQSDAVVDGTQSKPATLVPQKVRIAETKPTTPSKPKFHTQNSIYKLTQATLAEHFDKPPGSRNSRLIVRILFVCIIVNVASLAFETCDGQNRGSSAPGYPYLPDESVYKAIDAFFTCIYSTEFVGRSIARKRKRDVLSDPLTWIDFFSLGPWYLQLTLTAAGKEFNLDAPDGFAHTVGLLRLLRVVRLGYILRHYESMKILISSLKASIPPLMVTMFFLFTLIMLLATAIFYADPCYNFYTCPFTDIFNSAYFIMVTVATVGYGNQLPSTNNIAAMGISFVAMVFGQLYLAMPLAIVGNNFQDAYESYQQSKRRKLKRMDTTLNAFDSVKLHRKSQRLCEIHYQLLHAWRVVQLNIDKMLRKGAELTEGGNTITKGSTRASVIGQPQVLETLVDAQVLRLTKIKDAIDKLTEVHGEACSLLQSFVPHKRKLRVDSLTVTSSGESVLSQVFGRAKKVITKARFSSREQAPDARTLSHSHRGRLWLALEVPDSSRLATAVNRVMMGAALLSVWIFFCESMPELMGGGAESAACQRVVSSYCTSKGFSSKDSGCFVRFLNNTVNWNMRLDFTCNRETDHQSCYGSGLNFGSLDEKALSCVDAFSEAGAEVICFRMQCVESAAAIVDMEPYWIYFEWVFGMSFLGEMALRFYASHDRTRFFHDVYNIFDVLAVLPFAFEASDYAFFGVKPSYAIVATAPSFFSVIRVLKTMRILKLTRHFRGTKVLAQTAKEIWRQVLIPIFFLLTMCILAAAVYFEIERGTECFVGESCMWWHEELMTPEMARGLPQGKRILIQDRQRTIITDMLRSTWLSASTFTTVGYGDVRPRTPMGRMFTICIAVVASIYTAMPISLVGGKFRTLYARHAEKVVIRRGGSSTSWKTKRNLLKQSVRDDDSSHDPAKDPNTLPLLFKLEDEEIEHLRQFQSLKRVLQHLQRQIENLQEVNRDVLRTVGPKRLSVVSVDEAPASVSSNVTRKATSIEHAIQEKSLSIMDAILQFSSLVEKLQDAPPFYEAFLPEEIKSLHRGSGMENLLPPEMRSRLLQTHASHAASN